MFIQSFRTIPNTQSRILILGIVEHNLNKLKV